MMAGRVVQHKTRCKSAFWGGTIIGYIRYLDREFGAYSPDVFLETWTTKHERLGMEDRTYASSTAKSGPLANFMASARPCSFRDRVAVIDNVAVPCAYPNLRVHVADTRSDTGPLQDILISLHLAVNYGYTAAWIHSSHQRKRSISFSLVDGIRAFLDSDPDVYFSNPVYLAHSRESHELKQLRPDIRTRLRTAVQQFAPKTQLFDKPTLDRIETWLTGPPDAVIPEDIAEQLRIYLKSYNHLDPKHVMGLDLYVIARALKTTRDGKRCRLAVCYLGKSHIKGIQALLTTAGLYTTKKRVEQGAEDTPTHRCIVLNTGAPLSMATDEPDPTVYVGKTLPLDSHKRMVLQTPTASTRTPRRPPPVAAANPLARPALPSAPVASPTQRRPPRPAVTTAGPVAGPSPPSLLRRRPSFSAAPAARLTRVPPPPPAATAASPIKRYPSPTASQSRPRRNMLAPLQDRRQSMRSPMRPRLLHPSRQVLSPVRPVERPFTTSQRRRTILRRTLDSSSKSGGTSRDTRRRTPTPISRTRRTPSASRGQGPTRHHRRRLRLQHYPF